MLYAPVSSIGSATFVDLQDFMMLKLVFALLLLTTVTCAESRNISDVPEVDFCNDKSKSKFGVFEYIVLGTMLVISCAIGTFYGFFTAGQDSSNDFLLGGSNMGTIPMSLSLAASFITAVDLLGNPTEMYRFGTQFWTVCFAFFIVIPITSIFYLPVYMKLRLTSSFEYLEMRFSKSVRLFASIIYAIQMTLFTSVTVYAPALALSRVTSVDVLVAISLVYAVCIFYSSQGGMKAVIMTDTFQAAVLMFSLILVVVLGQQYVGSPSSVFDIVQESTRLEFFNLNISLTERHTLWTQIIGGVLYWVPMFCSNQASIQKYLSVKSVKQVTIALWVSAFSLIIVFSINFYTGMLVFTQYYKCDPLERGKKIVESEDEILPYYIMNVLGDYKGVPGIFVAGIFAASLGTVASALNSLAAVTIKDFMEAGLNIKIPESRGGIVSKWLSIAYGALSFVLIFAVKRINSVLKSALMFNGLVGGVTLGLFTLGMFLPWISSEGAFWGSLISLIFVSWVGINSQMSNYVAEFEKPKFNTTTSSFAEVTSQNNSDVFVLYKISYMWYSAIGFTMTILTALLISWMRGFADPCQINPELITPVMQRYYSRLSNSVKRKLGLPIEAKDALLNKNNVQLTTIVY